MRTSLVRIVVAGFVLFGCGEPREDDPPVAVATGSGGSGGKSTGPAGTGGSSSSVGSGGSGSGGATPTTASGGSGGSSASGGAAGGGSTGSGGAPASTDAGAGGSPAADTAAPPPVSSEGAPYGCTGCKRIFDGKTLAGWETATEGAWVVKESALASTGKEADIWTKEDFGNVRIFFQIRQISGNHKPGTILFGTRPAAGATPKRGLSGAQFQPPNGASWNYGAGGTFTRAANPNFDVKQWHQCEVVAKEAGSFRAACCPVAATPCKGREVLSWKGTGKKFPFALQMHNPGLFDEYKEIWAEVNPASDELLSMK